MRMRFRTDGWHYADLKTYGWVWEGAGEKSYGKFYKDDPEAKKYWDESPKAEPGDVWRIEWHGGGLAGYAICCIGCGHVHAWTTASNCQYKVTERSYVLDGETKTYKRCSHDLEHGSCWNWSGAAEENTLTASPSLQVTADDCKWHGYIQNGDVHT